MKISSPVFREGGEIPSKYTCEGENISPELHFSDVPEKAKSLVVIMDDYDVPKHLRADGTWDHWVLFNIPPKTTKIGEGKTIGIAGMNTSKKLGYVGPCPPDRRHTYHFFLYALDKELSLSSGSSKKEVLAAMEGHILEKATLKGTYEKKHAS